MTCKRIAFAALVACAVALDLEVPVGSAGGGQPSTAVNLPIGTQSVSSGTGFDMWTVTLNTNDELVLDVANAEFMRCRGMLDTLSSRF